MDVRVDVFCHIVPPRFDKARWDRVEKTHFVEHSPSHLKYVSVGKEKQKNENMAVLTDLDARFKMMDELESYRQVLSVASPAIEIVAPDDSETVAKILNDELAEIAAKHPKYFAGAVCSLPMDKPDAAACELERSLKDLKMLGVQLFTNCNGKPIDGPEYRPIFEIMSKYDLPILLHPARAKTHPDYLTEKESKYIIWQIIGWPYETAAAMFRIAFSGILDEYPNLKIICHHTGSFIPYLAGRMESMFGMFQGIIEQEIGHPLQRPAMDYFRLFYGDTATFTASSIECACDVLGADHVIFGSDAPFDAEGGRFSVRESTNAVNNARISAEDKRKIFYQNFETLFKVPAGITTAKA
ncbi:MAG: amidohydrolase [Acidobacteria bacterium]|nr:amidohydrolase [Acidobacteriota bacterium]